MSVHVPYSDHSPKPPPSQKTIVTSFTDMEVLFSIFSLRVTLMAVQARGAGGGRPQK